MADSGSTGTTSVGGLVGGGTSRSSDDRSLGELIATASRDLSLLIHSEIKLAKTELRTDVRRGAIGGALFAAAGFVVLLGVVFVSVALAYAISALASLPLGVAYLIVGGLYLLLATILALIGMRVLKRIRPPERTIKTVKEDIAWLKHPTAPPTPERSRAS